MRGLTVLLGVGCVAAVMALPPASAEDGGLFTDCRRIPIIGDGFGGANLDCEERLSLYAFFGCIPARKTQIEKSCPDWVGLEADIDWEAVDRLIEQREADAAEAALKEKRELDAMIERYRKSKLKREAEAGKSPAAEADKQQAP